MPDNCFQNYCWQQVFNDCCNCCCNDCCDNVVLRFQCGCPDAEFPDHLFPSNISGCPCSAGETSFAPDLFAQSNDVPSFSKMEPVAPAFPLPEFDPKVRASSNDNVFAFSLNNSCSIPCETIEVTITSSICCLDCYSGNQIQVIGNATITASVSEPTYSGCGPYTVRINGSIPPVQASNNDILTITLEPTDPNCCCTFLECENPCETAPLYSYKAGKFFLNQRALDLRKSIFKRRVKAKKAKAEFLRQQRGIIPKKRNL